MNRPAGAPLKPNGRIDLEALRDPLIVGEYWGDHNWRPSGMTPCGACGDGLGIHLFVHDGQVFWACYAKGGDAKGGDATIPFTQRPQCGCTSGRPHASPAAAR